MNLRRIIKEELLKEVGGYDDPKVMGQHAGAIMGMLSGSHSDLSNTLAGLANTVMDGAPKRDLTSFLKETSKDIMIFIDVIKRALKEFTEDDVKLKAKEVIKSLNSFKRKIDVLTNFSSEMGGDEQFRERLKQILMDLIPTLQEYGEQLQITNKMFMNRLSSFGSGFMSN